MQVVGHLLFRFTSPIGFKSRLSFTDKNALIDLSAILARSDCRPPNFGGFHLNAR